MTPILGILASGISGNLWAPGKDYDSIATSTLGSSTASVTFSSIPSTYKHLQLRIFLNNTGDNYFYTQMNGDTTASNYFSHYMVGNGTSTYAGYLSTDPGNLIGFGAYGGYFGAYIVDILDYTSVNKNKTIRSLHGYDTNSTTNQYVGLTSGAWANSSTAINSIKIFTTAGGATMGTNTKIALYGIKG
jgi:hypothetical protein